MKQKEYDVDNILFYWAISKDYSKRLRYCKERREKIGKKLFYNDHINFITYLFLDEKRDKSDISYKFIRGFLKGFIMKVILTSKNKDNIEITYQHMASLVLDEHEINFFNEYPDYKLHDVFLIIDNSKLETYITEYLDDWHNQKLKRKENKYYRTPQNHLNIFLKEIYRKFEAYGKEIPYDLLDIGNDFDNITPLLYLEKEGQIEINEYPDLIIEQRFHVKINDSFFEFYNNFFEGEKQVNIVENKDIVITSLEAKKVTFNKTETVDITPSEYTLMEQFKNTKSGKRQVDLLGGKTNNLVSLKQAQTRFNKKSRIKIRKVPNKNLWHLERDTKETL